MKRRVEVPAAAGAEEPSAGATLAAAVLDALPGQIAVLDQDGTIVMVNQAWRAFARGQPGGRDDAGVVGVNYLDAWRAWTRAGVNDAAQVLAGLHGVLTGERALFTVDYLYAQEPRPCWFEIRAEPLAWQAGWVMVSHCDVTARKRAELESLNRLHELAHVGRALTMGALAGSAAHELNQPLTAILSNAQAALRFLSSEAPRLDLVREILQDIAADDQRASSIIGRVRRLLRKGEPQDRVAVDLNEVVREAMRVLADEALLRRVRTTVLLESEDCTVAGDAIQLQQVLLNLVLNAFEAMEETDVSERQLTVQTRRTAELVQLCVIDSGPGVDSAHLSRIFEPFYTTKQAGMGMGLHITRAIIESHGGQILAAPHGERGLIVSVLLPLQPGAPSYGQSPMVAAVPLPTFT